MTSKTLDERRASKLKDGYIPWVTGKPCTKCEGYGEIFKYINREGEGDDSPAWVFDEYPEMRKWPHEIVTCPVCLGKGYYLW